MEDDAKSVFELPERELREWTRTRTPVQLLHAVRNLREYASSFYGRDARRAREIAARALLLCRSTEEGEARGWGERTMAEALLFSGRLREADRHYQRAEEAWRKTGPPGLLGELLVGRLHVLTHLGRLRTALEAAREARTLLEASGNTAYLAKLAMNLGTLHFRRDDYAAALEELERAAVLFAVQSQRDSTVLGLEVNRAVALRHNDRPDEALALFARLEQECSEKGLPLLLAQVRMNSANVFFQRGEFDLALRRIVPALQYFRETNHPALSAGSLLSRAELYHQLNLHAEALELAQEARQLFESQGMRFDQGLAAYSCALSSLALRESASARGFLREAGRLFRREGNAGREGLVQVVRAEALYQRGRRAQAAAYAARARRVFSRLRLVRWETAASLLLARIECERGRPGAAGRRLERARHRIDSRLYPIAAYEVNAALGHAYAKAKRPVRARARYSRALDLLETMRVRIPTEDSKLAFLVDKSDLYDRALTLALGEKRPRVERVFELMERARAQRLWDRIREPARYLEGSSRDRDPAREHRIEESRSRLAWLHSRISGLEMAPKPDRAKLRALQEQLASTERRWQRLRREDSEHPASVGTAPVSSRGPRETIPSTSLEILRERIPIGWGFLSYHLGTDFAIAIAVTRERVVLKTLAPGLQARVQRLTDALDFQWGAASLEAASQALDNPRSIAHFADDHPLVESTRSALGQLYEILWAPLESTAAEHNWIISPHGPSHRVPFHALLSPRGYLIEERELGVAPSARTWLALAEARARGQYAWVAGTVDSGLSAVESEIATVARHLPGWRVAQERHPVRGQLLEELGRADIVHLATHGSLRADNPAFTSIQLDDGPFFVHDLSETSLPGSLAVLTACSSGRGERLAGDEWVGLAQAFLQAGAATVVTSLWPIEDATTASLMNGFYEAVSSGASVSSALRRAELDLMGSRPHPWHWASFVAIGASASDVRCPAVGVDHDMMDARPKLPALEEDRWGSSSLPR